MYSVFRLITKSEYWQLLFRRATWSEARLQISRFHKDRRARRYTFGIAAVLIAPIVLLVYVAWLIGSGAVFLVPFVIPILWWRSRQQRHDAPLHITPSHAPPVAAISGEAADALLRYFIDLTLIYAAIIDRANSEGFVKQKELPEGAEVISRRVVIDLLRSRDLWDKISSCDREAMMMADGHWDWEMINESVSKLEELRLLRWIIGIDPYLPAIGSQLDLSLRLASDITNDPDKLLKTELRDIFDLRVAQHTADVYFLRCIAEGVTRRIWTAPTEEIKAWAAETSEMLDGDHNEDLLLDRKLVSEADDELLLRGFELSRRRNNFLKWVISTIESGAVADAPVAVLSGKPTRTTAPERSHELSDLT